jgi:hypothetical protein
MTAQFRDMEITDEMRDVWSRLGQSNVFITGRAGTGKSTLLQEFCDVTEKQVVKVAPTGVAAFNIGGSTIHSFFKFKPGGLWHGHWNDCPSCDHSASRCWTARLRHWCSLWTTLLTPRPALGLADVQKSPGNAGLSCWQRSGAVHRGQRLAHGGALPDSGPLRSLTW